MSEITPEVVYWVTRLDHIRMLLGWLSAVTVAISIVACIFAVVARDCDYEIREMKLDFNRVQKLIYDKEYVEETLNRFRKTAESINDLKRSIKKSLRVVMFAIIVFLLFFAGCAFIPDTKEACAILVIPQVANSDVVQHELPKSIKSIVEIANNYLEEILATPTTKGGEE